jgi:hypothetical protein
MQVQFIVFFFCSSSLIKQREGKRGWEKRIWEYESLWDTNG